MYNKILLALLVLDMLAIIILGGIVVVKIEMKAVNDFYRGKPTGRN